MKNLFRTTLAVLALMGLPTAAAAGDGGAPLLMLERISTAVPWPRGLAFVDGELIVLARGRHRRAGGPIPEIEDLAGHLFGVDPAIADVVGPDSSPSALVTGNARLFAAPTEPPFRLWDRDRAAATDLDMDRPYCTLAWDPASRNLFVCGFSGRDMPDGSFRKNPTDSVLRFDTRSDEWHVVDAHRGDLVSPDDLGAWVPSDTYPHHDTSANAPPHGWVNGPNGATVVGRWLYVVAKDNNLLVRYDLSAIQSDPGAPPPPCEAVLGDRVDLRTADGVTSHVIWGHSALAAHGGHLYIGFRTTSQVIRVPLDPDGRLTEPVVGDLVARFDPYDPQRDRSADLMDLTFNAAGELFVSTAASGRVWKIGTPDGNPVFDGRAGSTHTPYLDLRALGGNARARTGNITFDDRGRLYVCSGTYERGDYAPGAPLPGVIYRVSPALDGN